MNLRLRGAGQRDLSKIESLVKDYKFKLDVSHIQSLVIVEDLDSGCFIAVGSLVTILESMFVTDKSQPRKSRLEALKMLTAQADIEVKNLNFDSYHLFVTNDEISKVMKKHFKAVPTEALEVLVKHIE